MPDKEVKTVQDQIFYQYAKIVACSAFGLSDGREGECAGTLDSVDADGEMSVLDVDGVVGAP